MNSRNLPWLACSAWITLALPLSGCRAQSANGLASSSVPVVIAPVAATVTVGRVTNAGPVVTPEAQTATATNSVVPKESASVSAVADTNAALLATNAPVPSVATTGSTNAVAPEIPAVEIQVSEAIREIIRLAEAGLSDEVLLAYIENSPTRFNITSEEIVYLTDMGISETVIAALIKHRGTNGAGAQNSAATNEAAAVSTPTQTPVPQPPATVPQNPSVTVTATPEFEAGQQPQPTVAQSSVVYTTPPVTQVQYNYFYSSLAPYGSWIHVEDYGLCWRPTVAVINHSWKPYCDRGRWIYTDCGWYWHSDYSWGWAPFHYGRWYAHPRHGWVWTPDTTWGPAWVTWRYSDDYCGWAPLPPGARYEHGFGLRYRSGNVGISFDFGLSSDCYTFVPSSRFCDRTPWRYRVPAAHVGNIYHRTKVVNNYIQNNTVIINEGIGREKIAAVTRSEIRKVPVRDLPADNPRSLRPERLVKTGPETVVYRPQLPSESGAARARIERESHKDPAPSVKAGGGPLEAKLVPPSAVPVPSRTARGLPSDHRRIPTERKEAGGSATVAVPSRVNPADNPDTAPARERVGTSAVARREASPGATPAAPQPLKPAAENRGRVASSDPQLVHTPARPIQRREAPTPIPSASPQNSPRQIQAAPTVNQSSPAAVFNRQPAPAQTRMPVESYPKPAETRTSRSTTYGNVQSQPAMPSAVPSRNYAPPTMELSPGVTRSPYSRLPSMDQPAPSYQSPSAHRAVPSVNSRQELSKPAPAVPFDKRSFVQQAPNGYRSQPSSAPNIQSVPTPSRQSFSAPAPIQSQQLTPSPRSAPPSSSGDSGANRSSSGGSRRSELLR